MAKDFFSNLPFTKTKLQMNFHLRYSLQYISIWKTKLTKSMSISKTVKLHLNYQKIFKEVLKASFH